MIEVVLALVVVGLMLVAALRLVASGRMRSVHTVDRLAAQTLAIDMASEMIDLPVMDEEKAPVFGLEGADTPSDDERDKYNDIDDYHSLIDVGIVDRNGDPIDGFAAYERRVRVRRMDRSNPDSADVTNTGLVQVEISIYRDGRQIDSFFFYTAGKLGAGEDFVERIR